MFAFNNKDVSDYLEAVGSPREHNNLTLVGLAGANLSPDGNKVQLNEDPLNQWCDLVGFIGAEFGFRKATTKPGSVYTFDPTNPSGAAHLACVEKLVAKGITRPYHFTTGLHHGKYPCLVQAESFHVWRDKNRDGLIETGEPSDLGEFGIHIHHAAVGADAPVVGPWSAGCCVLNDIDDWNDFFAKVTSNGTKPYPFYLLCAKQFANWLTEQGRI